MIHTDSTGTETASPANPLPDVPQTGGPGYAAFRPFPPIRGRPAFGETKRPGCTARRRYARLESEVCCIYD